MTIEHAGLPAPDTVLRQVTHDLESVQIDGEAVVYDGQRDALHLLDPIATLIFCLLDGTTSLQTLSSELATDFERPVAQVLCDVRRFAAQLVESGLAEPVT